MRAAWLVLLLLPPWAPAVADTASIASARMVIDQCNVSAKASSEGLPALRAACPQIDAAADALGLDTVLPRDWRSRVDAHALADLAAAAARYAAPAPHALPDATQLRILARALQPRPTPASWWDRVLAWLRQWLASSGSNWSWWPDFHWPWHWHGSPDPRLWTLILYALGALIVVAAIAVAVIEIRAARNPARRRRPSDARSIADSISPDEAGPPLHAIESATADQQPVLALRLLVGALIRSHRLTRDRNLTCRELVSAARFDGPAQQAQFQILALLAERALYGDHQQPAPAETSGVPKPDRMDLDGVRKLYAALLAPQHEAQPAP